MAAPIVTADHAVVSLPPPPANVTVTFNGHVMGKIAVTFSPRPSVGVSVREAAATNETIRVGTPPRIVFVREVLATEAVHTSEVKKTTRV